ncbi:hypothetical protein BDQ94DRAFT_30340 [Aspergillus welwitschiae]|uniref:Uncharacterized protein n=1 Tax=Aspergillus welwitschiae TaxID=1341132 RepID=A0A3F3Q2V2_9EURO|nr:hypothetical protein BDQ94DRAFT_30340 [Aspergillus welwitschiae]RDH33520.1 hypothetical protein BDQ94DRAFT_30340 [Aspergillus welwitschiae]
MTPLHLASGSNSSIILARALYDSTIRPLTIIQTVGQQSTNRYDSTTTYTHAAVRYSEERGFQYPQTGLEGYRLAACWVVWDICRPLPPSASRWSAHSLRTNGRTLQPAEIYQSKCSN